MHKIAQTKLGRVRSTVAESTDMTGFIAGSRQTGFHRKMHKIAQERTLHQSAKTTLSQKKPRCLPMSQVCFFKPPAQAAGCTNEPHRQAATAKRRAHWLPS
jgi:hypothetical protein